VIFSQALNAIKMSADSQQPTKYAPEPIKKRITLNTSHSNNHDNHSHNNSSILSRIKVTKKNDNQPQKSILSRKEKTEEPSLRLFSIQKKVIKKDISHRLAKNTIKENKSSSDDVWKHDLFSDGPSLVNNSFTCSIFMRNLPDNIDYEFMKSLLKEEELVAGIKIEKDTAEVNFMRKDAAQRAVENLNGRMVKGKRLKVALISELNAATLKNNAPTSNHSNSNPINLESSRRESPFDRRMQIDEEISEQRSNIISRIKKNH